MVLHRPAEAIDADDPPPQPPVPPDAADCCGGGCVHCVFDLYEAALKRHAQSLARWRARHHRAPKA
jgi:Oxidoreductase-like protein, N-terminal.